MAQKKATTKKVATSVSEEAVVEQAPKKAPSTKKKGYSVGDSVAVTARVISTAKNGKDICIQVLNVEGNKAQAYKTLWLSV